MIPRPSDRDDDVEREDWCLCLLCLVTSGGGQVGGTEGVLDLKR